jgi:hypothetical protein
MPNGGARMAYMLGAILHQHYNFDVKIVRINHETIDNTIFSYPHRFEAISIDSALENATKNHILICNPSFSQYGFGLRTPCHKLMYVQGFSTFSALDGFFDKYVSVSDFVAQYLKIVYNIDSDVIPAYVEGADPAEYIPWRERPADKILVHSKHQDPLGNEIVQRVATHIRLAYPGITLIPLLETSSLPHCEILSKLKAYRYFISLSLTEGFGLLPLEAMSVGTVVFGFNGFGGAQYMSKLTNAGTVPYPDMDSLQNTIDLVLGDAHLAERISINAIETAKSFSFSQFETAWLKYLKQKGLATSNSYMDYKNTAASQM